MIIDVKINNTNTMCSHISSKILLDQDMKYVIDDTVYKTVFECDDISEYMIQSFFSELIFTDFVRIKKNNWSYIVYGKKEVSTIYSMYYRNEKDFKTVERFLLKGKLANES